MTPDRQKVRKDIQTYENQKKIKRLAQLGTIAGLAGMGYGGFTGNKRILLSSAGTALLGGYGAGRAEKARDQALGRIKRYYDLRDDRLINVGAVLPSRETFNKHAVAGGVVELLSAIPTLFTEHWQPMSHWIAQHSAPLIGAAAPTAIDLAATPWLGKQVIKSGRNYAHVMAKHMSGLPLAPSETRMLGKVLETKGSLEASRALKDTPWKAVGTQVASDMKSKGALPGMVAGANTIRDKAMRGLREYFYPIFKAGPTYGAELGTEAGKVLKGVGEISPKYRDLGLNAIKNQAALGQLKDQATKDLATLSKGVDAAKGTRLAKLLTRIGKGSAPSVKQVVSDIVENPEKLEQMVNRYKNFENKAVRGTQAVGAGAGAAIIANAIGQMRGRHPLSKDELPTQLATVLPPQVPRQKANS